MKESANGVVALVFVATLGVGVGGCEQPPSESEPVGTLTVSLSDTEAVHVYDVILTGPDGFRAEQYAGVAQDGVSAQLIAAAFFTLAPGYYDVTAAPVHGHGTPAPSCAPAHGTAHVTAGQTTGLTLISSCKSTSAGGLDVTIVPNGAPDWISVGLAPSVLAPVCQNVTITLTANDPESDPTSYTLELTSPVHGSHPSLSLSGAIGTFTADRNGTYGFTANACDPYACSPFTFTVSLTMTSADDVDGDGLADACEPAPSNPS